MLNLFKGLKNDLIKYKNIYFLYRFDFRSKCYGEYNRIIIMKLVVEIIIDNRMCGRCK